MFDRHPGGFIGSDHCEQDNTWNVILDCIWGIFRDLTDSYLIQLGFKLD